MQGFTSKWAMKSNDRWYSKFCVLQFLIKIELLEIELFDYLTVCKQMTDV